MLFDLLQVATDLGCQMESLLSSVQQRQHQQHIQTANETNATAATRQQTNAQATRLTNASSQKTISSASRHRAPSAVCKPLDLSLKTSSCEPSESSPELNGNLIKFHEDAPLNLVKSSDGRDQLACLSSASPASSSSSIYSSTRSWALGSSASSALSVLSCDRRKAECDNNNNTNTNNSQQSAIFGHDEDHLEELRNSSNEVHISSTNGRQPERRRVKKCSTTAKSHLCEHCGRSFSRSDMLTRHSRLHSGLKPYQCAKCLQVFSRSDHLSTHERTHTGEKPYQCRFCSYSACRRDMITRHMRTHTIGRLGSKSRSSRRRTRDSKKSKQQVASKVCNEDDVSTSAEVGVGLS